MAPDDVEGEGENDEGGLDGEEEEGVAEGDGKRAKPKPKPKPVTRPVDDWDLRYCKDMDALLFEFERDPGVRQPCCVPALP